MIILLLGDRCLTQDYVSERVCFDADLVEVDCKQKVIQVFLIYRLMASGGGDLMLVPPPVEKFVKKLQMQQIWFFASVIKIFLDNS